MDQDKTMLDDFKQAKIVYLTTFSKDGRRSRQMANFNESPHEKMWFQTYRDTRKVEDIKNNPRVIVTFPSVKRDEFWELEGRAEIEEVDTTSIKWKWWYLYWLPTYMLSDWLSRPEEKRQIKDVAIINVYPTSVNILRTFTGT